MICKMENERLVFLTKMYDQMFNDINRHILVVWQSIGVIVGAFAIFALVEKGILSIDIAAGVILLLCAWSIAHIFDSSYWYNPNLVIIANIERQFLKKEDLKEIQWYFSTHRKANKMISHLRIQLFLSFGLIIIVLIYHFSTQIYPGFNLSWPNFKPEKFIPYIISITSYFFLKSFVKGKNQRYEEFIKRSPGKEMETQEDETAIGHGQS